MRILIDDGLTLSKKKLTGIGWHTKVLIENLKRSGCEIDIPSYGKFFFRLPSIFKRVAYIFYFSRKELHRKDIDCIHYTNFYVPKKKTKIKKITTIHDFTVFNFPETLSKFYRYYARVSIENAINYSDAIIVPSKSIEVELKRRFNIADNKINVIFQEVRESFFEKRQKLLKANVQKNKKENFFLYVGVLERRKNIKFLCKAFDKFQKQDNKDTKLYLVGKKGLGYEEIKKYIDKNDNIIYKSYVSDEELLSLYKNAMAFVFTSLYEGFGKPIVESMFFNIPIIASNIPTNVELNRRHGSKMYMFELDDINELCSKMEEVYNLDIGDVQYSNLELYHPKEIAKRHKLLYKRVLKG
ncbi:glycosyltransferase involved in cell wall biosynthesis [Orenia metallireducens]|uniref:glycosyltransferase family 4 protein n=1 Tax=Orenia metallireducens TaxID=1413210 RepID=UPI000D07C378|nr:glycosyltransferase family 1 protein [Orenia metallireducens]PRX35675.1 glycosyltransferase involved in cell wall biosynthesis [Orenia metallireducens]